MIFGVNI